MSEIQIRKTVDGIGLEPVFTEYIYQKNSVFSGTARQRAESLMSFYRDPEISVIFDISGGDLANEVLPYLDYDVIASSGKEFWGYSDLTTVINAIYARTGKSSVLYQVKNLVSAEGASRQAAFENTLLKSGSDLYDISVRFLQGKQLEGILIGGNIRFQTGVRFFGGKYCHPVQILHEIRSFFIRSSLPGNAHQKRADGYGPDTVAAPVFPDNIHYPGILARLSGHGRSGNLTQYGYGQQHFQTQGNKIRFHFHVTLRLSIVKVRDIDPVFYTKDGFS